MEDLTPCVWKLALSYAPVEGWVIKSDVHGLLDGLSGAMCLPAYDGEIAHTDRILCNLPVLVEVDRGS